MAGFLQSYLSVSLCCADDQRATRRVDHLVRDEGQVIDLQDAFDLYEQTMQQSEIAAGDSGNRGYGLGVRKICRIEIQPELAPVTGEDER